MFDAYMEIFPIPGDGLVLKRKRLEFIALR